VIRHCTGGIALIHELTRVHDAQLLTYLKLSGYRLGFLMNFNVALFKHGLRRYVL
jgi:GxxExxY protein